MKWPALNYNKSFGTKKAREVAPPRAFNIYFLEKICWEKEARAAIFVRVAAFETFTALHR